MATLLGLIGGWLTLGMKVGRAFVSSIILHFTWPVFIVYFGQWLPEQFHTIPFMHTWGLLITISILKSYLPTLVSSSSSSSSDKSD